jgi:hypothetical protein
MKIFLIMACVACGGRQKLSNTEVGIEILATSSINSHQRRYYKHCGQETLVIRSQLRPIRCGIQQYIAWRAHYIVVLEGKYILATSSSMIY